MKVVVQRVKEQRVTNKSIHNEIDKGFCLLVGIGKDTTEADIDAVAKRLLTLVCLKMRMANLI